MGIRGLTAAVVLFFLVAAPVASAADPRPAVVVVAFDRSHVTVQVLETTSLAGVVEALCRETGTRCEIGPEEQEALAAETVPPLILQGTWTEVLAQLFAGTSFNYFSSGRGGRLLVEARRPASQLPPAEGRRSVARRGGTARPDDSDLPDSFRRTRVTRPEPSSPEEQRARPRTPSTSDSLPFTRALRTRTSQGGMGSSREAPPANPAAVTFMDQPVRPWAGPRVSPFLDENGNPMPLSGEPITASPFPDENGNPVPVEPRAPGQPRGSPFPPPTTGSKQKK